MSLPLTWVLFCPQNRTSARIHIHVTYFDIHAGLVTKHNDNFRQRAKVYVWLKEVHGDDVTAATLHKRKFLPYHKDSFDRKALLEPETRALL